MAGNGVIAMKNEFDYLNDVKMDFGMYEEEPISEMEINIMAQNVNKKRRTFSVKKLSVLAACVAIVAITGTAFASGFAGDIIKYVTTGHSSYIQTDANAAQELPEELKGKIFDKNGVAYERATQNDILNNAYDAEGNKLDKDALIQLYEDSFGDKVNFKTEDNIEDHEYVFASLEEAQKEAEFDIKIPDVPNGYELSRIYTFTNDDGSMSGKYINLLYTNDKGKEINVMERLIDDETKFTASTDGELEEIQINGRTVVIADNRNIDFETADSVSVSILSGGNMTRNELIKAAEGILK